MRPSLLVGCLLLLGCLAGTPVQAQVLYDGFAAGYIDPARWNVSPLCVSPRAYDCAREVQQGLLHLAARGYGAAEVPEAQVLFTNPVPIDTIRVSFVVSTFSVLGCPGGPPAHPQLAIYGSFFNGGAGVGDVSAFLIVERSAGEGSLPAGTLGVSGFTMSDLGFSDNVDLGRLRVGEPATATLKWDRNSHTFTWRVVKAITHPHVAEQVMGYPFADFTPPGTPTKALTVRSFAPSCADGDSVAAMDVWIDKVAVNASALP